MREDEEFMSIIGPQIRMDMADTLGNMLGSCFETSSSAVDYVVRRLWVDDEVYRARTGEEAEEE